MDRQASGDWDDGFASVVKAFEKELPAKGPGGGALCVYWRGRKVLDVWGGSVGASGAPWQQDTITFSASTTKGLVSTLIHCLVDHGVLAYDTPIVEYWPEFGANGKSDITLRHILCHESGLYDAHQVRGVDEAFDWDHVLRVIEQSEPAHPPGAKNVYHALSYGHLLGGVAEKATGKGFSELFREFVVAPLGLEGAYIGLSDDAMARVAPILPHDGFVGRALAPHRKWPGLLKQVCYHGLRVASVDLGYFHSALLPPYVCEVDFNDENVMRSPMPAMNGVFDARSLAKAYLPLACGGMVGDTQFLSQETVYEMGRVQSRRRDKVLIVPMRWRLGYHQVSALGVRMPKAFGHLGLGGSGGWSDPQRGLSFGYVHNRGLASLKTDTAIIRLTRAVVKAADRAVC